MDKRYKTESSSAWRRQNYCPSHPTKIKIWNFIWQFEAREELKEKKEEKKKYRWNVRSGYNDVNTTQVRSA